MLQTWFVLRRNWKQCHKYVGVEGCQLKCVQGSKVGDAVCNAMEGHGGLRQGINNIHMIKGNQLAGYLVYIIK